MVTDLHFKTEEGIRLKNERVEPSDGNPGKSPHQMDKTDKKPKKLQRCHYRACESKMAQIYFGGKSQTSPTCTDSGRVID